MSFQLSLLQEINSKNVGENVMISPLSVYHILALTANGAAKKTLEAMLTALQEKDVETMNATNKDVGKAMGKFSSVEFANGVFTLFDPEKVFLDAVKKYNAKIEKLKDVEQVNKWVSDSTHEKITQIIDEVDADALMVLLNAIYFKGQWKKEFQANDTKKREFMNLNKEAKEGDFMNMTDKLDFYENDTIQAISLDYKKDNMKGLIILPKEKGDINEYIKNFTAEEYAKIVKELKNQKVVLSLPKFEVDYKADLQVNLNALGMKEAFCDSADFSVMKKENDVFIKQVLHKTMLKVDEKGTEAAATTAVVVSRNLSIDPTPIPVMTVDHPFLFIVRTDKLQTEHEMIKKGKIEKN